MISKWYEHKKEALRLRTEGRSMGRINQHLGIPKSTLSGWFKNVILSASNIKKLQTNRRKALSKARIKAALWHREQKQKRLQTAQDDAQKVLNEINTSDNNILELTLALLYMGEGSKTKGETAIGSSNPLILKFFLAILKKIYNLNPEKIRCQLNLRADQNPLSVKRFWAKELNLSLKNFKQVNIDKRTIGSKTYPSYKGVCEVRYGNVDIQRKLVYLGSLFCDKITGNNLGG